MTVTIRPLQENDRAPVIAMLKEGVALKHFLPTAYTQANALLGAALSGVPFTMIKLRAGQTRPHQITSRAWVAEVNSVPAAFALSLVDANEIEIHLAWTLKALRRTGCMTALIQHEITLNNGQKRIYARCYKKSTWAVSCFQKNGFTLANTGDPVELTL